MLQIDTIYNMDCLEGLKKLPANFVDSIVTDPPYELGFMGKHWDRTGIAYNTELWRECLRVLKPGGHLLAFGGARTYHRMACAVEDAGFEIRDCIMWIYGQGFPKSLDISKAIDKELGAERKIVGEKITPDGKPISKRVPHSKDGYHPSHTVLRGATKHNIYLTAPATPEAKQWEGWGTALKPAYEPIVLARKPISEKNIALNVLKWKTGGLNIDGCRVPLNGEKPPAGSARRIYKSNQYTAEKIYGDNKQTSLLGRYPANVIHDGSDEVLSLFPHTKSGKMNQAIRGGNFNVYGRQYPRHVETIGDEGSAARFFYCAKASKKERGGFNNHPTVKPLSLIKYLIKLVTPPGGICLDPFEGSGTHAVACIELGFHYIGFEKEEEYYSICMRRIQECRASSGGEGQYVES